MIQINELIVYAKMLTIIPFRLKISGIFESDFILSSSGNHQTPHNDEVCPYCGIEST